MVYSILFTDQAKKQLSKINKDAKKRIIEYLENRVVKSPLRVGKSLVGDKKGL